MARGQKGKGARGLGDKLQKARQPDNQKVRKGKFKLKC